MFETTISTLTSKLSFYTAQIGTFSVLNIPFQVLMSVCPVIFRYMTNSGYSVLVVVGGMSLLHYRLFHIFFVLVLLNAKLPDEKDKNFWRSVGIFTAIVCLWLYLGFLSMMNWTTLAQLNGG